MQLRLAVEFAPEHARLGSSCPGVRVDPDALHRRQVDYQPLIADRVAGDTVSAGTDCDEQVALASEPDGRDHIGDARAAGNAGWVAVERAIPDPACGIVAGASRQQKLS